jgi:hypothetical protein
MMFAIFDNNRFIVFGEAKIEDQKAHVAEEAFQQFNSADSKAKVHARILTLTPFVIFFIS